MRRWLLAVLVSVTAVSLTLAILAFRATAQSGQWTLQLHDRDGANRTYNCTIEYRNQGSFPNYVPDITRASLNCFQR